MILDNDCELVGDLAAVISSELKAVVLVTHFLTFDFELAFLAVVSEE